MYTFKTSALKEYLVRMFYLSLCISINVLFRVENRHFRDKTVEDMGGQANFSGSEREWGSVQLISRK